MRKGERDSILYLEDMIQAIANIQDYTQNLSFEEFKNNSMVKDAVIRNFEIIGEAANNLPDSITSKYTNVPWADMYGLRNRVTHEYFGVDYGIIWRIAKEYLPDNLEIIKSIRDSL